MTGYYNQLRICNAAVHSPIRTCYDKYDILNGVGHAHASHTRGTIHMNLQGQRRSSGKVRRWALTGSIIGLTLMLTEACQVVGSFFRNDRQARCRSRGNTACNPRATKENDTPAVFDSWATKQGTKKTHQRVLKKITLCEQPYQVAAAQKTRASTEPRQHQQYLLFHARVLP